MVETKKCQGNNNGKERLHFIDVAKGILILLVVYGHLYAWTTKLNPDAADYVLQSINLFVSFYMPAFFVITGFCSNFKKPFAEFIFSSFKTILLPGISFAFLDAIISFDVNIRRMYIIGKDFLLFGGRYWFLSALFVGRIIYWFLYNNLSRKKTTICCISLFVIGFAIEPHYKYYEIWWFIHAMMLTPYLCMGQYLRLQKRIHFVFAAVIYVVTLMATTVLSAVGILQVDYYYMVPAIVQWNVNLNYTMIIPLIVLSVSGSIMIIGIAKRIRTNKILEFLGQNSLAIYCMHGLFLREFSLIMDGNSLSVIQYYMFVMAIFLFTTIFSCIIAYIFNRRYLKFLIGKF